MGFLKKEHQNKIKIKESKRKKIKNNLEEIQPSTINILWSLIFLLKLLSGVKSVFVMLTIIIIKLLLHKKGKVKGNTEIREVIYTNKVNNPPKYTNKIKKLNQWLLIKSTRLNNKKKEIKINNIDKKKGCVWTINNKPKKSRTKNRIQKIVYLKHKVWNFKNISEKRFFRPQLKV